MSDSDDSEDTPSAPLGPQRCPVCDKTEGLKRCGGCKVVSYCGTEHQTSHRTRHKRACNEIKKTQAELDRREAELRAPTTYLPASIRPANPFETCVGRFWRFASLRDYMMARYAAALALYKVKSRDAVEKSLEHFTDMLRLDRSDGQGVRDVIPHLMLRLGREQECYDFLKWYATTGTRSDYDWSDTTLPFLDIHGADVFEWIDIFVEGVSLSHFVAVTLLKLRVLLDLHTFQDGDHYHGRPMGPIATKYFAGEITNADIDAKIEILDEHYHKLLLFVDNRNPHFWSALVEDMYPILPSMITPGEENEAMLVLHQSRDAWKETKDAIPNVESDMFPDNPFDY